MCSRNSDSLNVRYATTQITYRERVVLVRLVLREERRYIHPGNHQLGMDFSDANERKKP